MDTELLIFIIVFCALWYTDRQKIKHEQEISLYRDIGRIIILQRTLYLCKYALQILFNIKDECLIKNKKITTKEILEILSEKGLRELIDGYNFCICDWYSINFEITDDDLSDFIAEISIEIEEITDQLTSIRKNGIKYFNHPGVSFSTSLISTDERFLPLDIINEIKKIYK